MAPNPGEDAKKPCHIYMLPGMWNGTATPENILVVSLKAKYVALYNPELLLLNNFPWEFTFFHFITHDHTKICEQILMGTLFFISKNWHQPTCPSVGEWSNQPHDTDRIGYHWALKNNELLIHITWVNLHRIMLSEEDPLWKIDILYVFLSCNFFMCSDGHNKFYHFNPY